MRRAYKAEMQIDADQAVAACCRRARANVLLLVVVVVDFVCLSTRVEYLA